MALAADVHRVSVEDYLAIAEVSDMSRTELIEGVIYDMAPEGPGHRDVTEDIFIRLLAIVGRRAHMAGSVRVSGESMWEPDVYVEYPGTGPGYPDIGACALVAEVSISSIQRDIGPRLKGYAGAMVPAYWLILPKADPGYALIHTDPKAGIYQQVRRIELPNGCTDLPVEDLWGDVERAR